jgi:hypothetical protein
MRGVAALVAALLAGSFPVSAQTGLSVVVTGPAGNPITDGIATFTVTASNFLPADLPMRLQLQVSTNPAFDGPLFADTTVDGPVATIRIPRLLPPATQIFWRAVALTARAGSIPSAITGPRTTPLAHLRLVSPNNAAGQSLNTRRPRFVWSASRIPPDFGAWEFTITVEETATGRTFFTNNTTFPDTTFTSAIDLESNKSYRWRVTARLPNTGDEITVASLGTFVVLSDDEPLTTVLFDPFPSPFPTAGVTRACIWFDLSVNTPITLSVIDLRGLSVKTIFSSASEFPRGRYGRPQSGVPSGCDDRFSWNGTDSRNRTVQPGAYLIMLRTGSGVFRTRVVFQGR